MTFATRFKRASAISLALVVAAAGLSLAPIAVSAASASNASQGADAAKRVDSLRKSAGLGAFKDNGFNQRYVDRYVSNYAKKGKTFADNDTTYAPAEGAIDGQSLIIRFTNYKDSAIPKAFATNVKSLVTTPRYNFGSVSYYKYSSTVTYVAVIGLQYETAPLDLLSAGTPTISGTAALGSKLTARISAKPSSGLSYNFLWKAGGEQIGGNTQTLTISDAGQIGKKITVTVTVAKDGYKSVTKTSAATKALAQGTFKGKTPVVSGSRVVGNTLTITQPTWGPSGTSYSYTWLRNGKTIPNQTGGSYTLTGADRGKLIDARISASLSGYKSGAVKTATKSKVLGVISILKPTINGGSTAGTTLTVSTGTWTPKPSKVTYKWYRDGVVIKNATAKSYKTTTADRNREIKVRVTGSLSGYQTATAASGGKAIN